MADDRPGRAPFAPAHGVLVPIASLTLSIPTIVVGLAGIIFTTYEIVTGRSLVTTSQTLQLPGLGVGCLYLIMGPLLAVVLCITQRTRAEEVYGSALLLGFRIKRLNTIALRTAVLALATIALIAVLGVVNLSLNPQ